MVLQSTGKEKQRLFYGMRLILMKNNHPTNNICKQRRSPKEEKLMNIDLRGHSWHAAFCHAMRS